MLLSIVSKRICLLTFATLVSALPASAQLPHTHNSDTKVIARISKQFIEDVAARIEVSASVPYDATVLGFYSQGVIDGRGHVSVDITAVPGSANFVIHSYGTGETYVRGVRGPFVAMGPAWGSFAAQTVVQFDGRHFVMLDTTPWTQVHFQLDRIEGVRGRPVGRVLGSMLRPLGQHLVPRVEADATPIADYYLKKTIDDFGHSVIRKLNETNPIDKLIGRLFPESRHWVFQLSSDPIFIQTAFGPPGSRVPALPAPPAGVKNVCMELWLRSTATEAQNLAQISKLPLAKGLVDKYVNAQLPEIAALGYTRSLSAVGPWLVISIGKP